MGLIEDLRRGFSALTEEPGAPMTEAQLTTAAQADAYRRSREERVQARSLSLNSFPDLDTQLLAVQGITNRPWHGASIREALGTPAIFRAVTLISSTTGSLAMEGYRNGIRLSDARTPKLIKRPDPFRIPRDFYRDTAYDLATRGEFWWWIAARDIDNSPLSLIRVPPWEVTVTPNDRDRLRPTIKWFDREMRREDMRHGTFLLDDTGYRGVGPLQLCGAAASVAVESQFWAANFYAGGKPSYLIKARGSLSEDPETARHEADTLRDQIMGRDPNTPMVVDDGIEDVKDFPVDPQGSQMLEARESNKGDAANMFGIPGALLEYGRPGSSLTYQNIAEVFTLFVKTCLAPLYLEPIEQHLSDLLPRSTVARFNVKGFERADVKTRWEVYQLAAAILGTDEAAALAREGEGLSPGDVEFVPIPFAPPQAIPTRLPIEHRTGEVRCDGRRLLRGLIKPCGKLLAEAGPFIGTCPRCGKEHMAAA